MRKSLACLGFLMLWTTAPAYAAIPVQEVTVNGTTAWLIEDHSLPIVTVKLAFADSGASRDPDGKDGLASFTANMLDEGAGDMDSLAFHQALESHAIHFSADADEDALTVTVETLSEFKGEALGLLQQALSKPRFDAEAVERVRAATLSDVRQMEESPAYLASLNWKKLAFADYPPYRHPRLGTRESIAAITPADLRQFAAWHFTCPRRIVAVVGDIGAGDVKHFLAGLPQGGNCTQPSALADAAIPDGGAAPVVLKTPVAQTVVQASFPALKREDPLYYSLFVLNHILGGDSLTSRLGGEIRNKRGLAYSVETEIETLAHADYLTARFATRNAQTDAAFDVFRAEIARIREHGVSADELADAKHYLEGSFPLQLDSEDTLAGYLVTMQREKLGRDYLEKRNAKIDAVRLEDVNALAQRILSHPPLVVMVGNPGQK